MHIKYYYGLPGQKYFIDPELIYTEIHCITRSGIVYKQQIVAPGNMEFVFFSPSGKVLFRDAFLGATVGRIDRNTLERISVKYKT
jgi:hypothetical protein